LRSDRFDVFYSIDRPLHPSEWLSITPVAGGRLTYYAKAVGDRNDYTRWLGEVGMDAELRGSGMFDYRNALWNIDGLRHLITPRFSYRYIPEIDKGETYIPSIDRRVFSTDLQPLDLGAMRNIDDLHGAHVLRLGLANILQTRDATDLSLTPASWLRFSMFQRLSTRTLGLHEFNARFELIDQDWWTVRLGSNYLQHQLEEYSLEFDRRVNEVWKGFVRVRYDDLARRWNELAFGLRQNLRNTWSVRYEVSWNHGQQRESSFGLNVMIDLIRF
jgi:LPS-assembly protein